jgi:hypothetical protein
MLRVVRVSDLFLLEISRAMAVFLLGSSRISSALRLVGRAGFFACIVALAGCESTAKVSSAKAKESVPELIKAATEDVRQLKAGLPLGAAEVAKLLPSGNWTEMEPSSAKETLNKARSRVQDLRVAKSTFFALVAPTGVVVRSDGEQDRLVGKDMFAAFPALRGALEGRYVETRGSMVEAAEVKGRGDGQRVVAAPILSGSEARGLFVSGWSWSAYAYRLENAARSSARSATEQPGKVPLLYVYMVVGRDVFGAPVSPEVNAKAIKDLDVVSKVKPGEIFATELELTGRAFGLAAGVVPELGPAVAIALLRSET